MPGLLVEVPGVPVTLMLSLLSSRLEDPAVCTAGAAWTAWRLS